MLSEIDFSDPVSIRQAKDSEQLANDKMYLYSLYNTKARHRLLCATKEDQSP